MRLFILSLVWGKAYLTCFIEFGAAEMCHGLPHSRNTPMSCNLCNALTVSWRPAAENVFIMYFIHRGKSWAAEGDSGLDLLNVHSFPLLLSWLTLMWRQYECHFNTLYSSVVYSANQYPSHIFTAANACLQTLCIFVISNSALFIHKIKHFTLVALVVCNVGVSDWLEEAAGWFIS